MMIKTKHIFSMIIENITWICINEITKNEI